MKKIALLLLLLAASVLIAQEALAQPSTHKLPVNTNEGAPDEFPESTTTPPASGASN